MNCSPVQRGITALPPELLDHIFCYLPVSDHFSCALVCRRWYAQLPTTRLRLARWNARQTRRPPAHSDWAIDYSCRLHPSLVSHNTALQRQLQALLRQQDLLKQHKLLLPPAALLSAQQQELTARRCLSGLLLHSLHQRITQADQLTLDAVPMEEMLPVTRATFSPCGRWLATAQRLAPALACGFLHIHAARQDRWQQEILMPRPWQPVEQIAFCEKQPDTLFSAHKDGQILRWHRQADPDCPDMASWHPSPVGQVNGPYQCKSLHGLVGGSLMALYSHQQTHDPLLCLIRWPGDDQGRSLCVATNYQGHLCAMALAPTCEQLALAIFPFEPDSACPQMHIWEPDLTPALPGQWGCKETPLPHQEDILALSYSPASLYLLGLLASGRVCLWELDAERKLQPRLDIACALPVDDKPALQSNILFSQDCRRLAIPCCAHKILFWEHSEKNGWLYAETAILPLQPDDPADDALRYIMLSVTGHALVRVCQQTVSLWQRRGAKLWQKIDQLSELAPEAPPPRARVLNSHGLFCTTMTGPTGKLCIYGTDQRGQLVRKAAAVTGAPQVSLLPTPDGLSLLTASTDKTPVAWQLRVATDQDRVQQQQNPGA